MENTIIEKLKKSYETAFIDDSIDSDVSFRPQFISNDHENGHKVLSTIEGELSDCKEFLISVAFITQSGITPLLQTLKELEKRHIRGKILTTDYLTFSEPKALQKLANLENVELRMYHSNHGNSGFHTKGYIFYANEVYRMIIGSSNITLSALTTNKEWNTKIVSTCHGEYAKNILKEFDFLWGNAQPLQQVIDDYTNKYSEHKKILKMESSPIIYANELEPNSMQLSFIENLQEIRKKGEQRALLISATGTGKTYASAFALRQDNPKKALFLVHREQIAKQALKSYYNVFGKSKKLGLLSGTSKNFEAGYLFATMQTMAKEEVMKQFAPDEFENIIIDEVHRAGASSYQDIMDYFKPKFWLGMTASPDRLDGFDIYELFDHNIAYEIRLKQALEEDLLCPFHYFGITDLEIDGETFDDASELKNFGMLTSSQRIDYVIEKVEYFGYSGEQVKGLIFCSRKEEGRILSDDFNHRGYRTVFLCGEDKQEKREAAIERLISDDEDIRLDYIFTVDIFNEGVDIPEINQVVMLRPTESPTIFIQQLGRGLRKAEGKEYVVILDFIGNYTNNFMIPIALSGDRSYNKDTIRKYVMEGTRIIPGSSSIHFDEISKKRIFASIDKIATTKKLLREKYFLLKNKVGRIPSILDFYEFSEIDPLLFISYAGTYHNFLKMIDDEYDVILSEKETELLDFVSAILVNGKRPHELTILKKLMQSDYISKEQLLKTLEEQYGIHNDLASIDSAIQLLQGRFVNTQKEKERYSNISLIKEDGGMYTRLLQYYTFIQHGEFKKQLSDLLELGLLRYQDLFSKRDGEDNLTLYQKYSRKDVCRLLNWERDDSSTIYGYKIKDQTCPIFVTYEKKDNIANSTKYEDQFIDNKRFSWMTRNRVSINSKEAQALIHAKDYGLKIYLFIKKSDGEGSDFYYLGKASAKKWNETIITNDKGKELPIMNFELELENPVREDLYDYFVK